MTLAAERPLQIDIAPAGLFADPLADRIAGFIRWVGLAIEPATLEAPTLLPGVTVRGGGLLVDARALAHPGDLLHEAGHLAVCEPPRRAGLDDVGDDPGEEMAALAWSYAATCALGLDPAVVFHADGYRGGGQALITGFTRGDTIGWPLLAWYGMTIMPNPRGGPPDAFPHMSRWLR